MARRPSVRIKNGHWFSEAGGVGRYFGRCDAVTHAEAMARLWAALAGNDAGGDRVMGVAVGEDANACVDRTNESSPHRRSAKGFVRSNEPSPTQGTPDTHQTPNTYPPLPSTPSQSVSLPGFRATDPTAPTKNDPAT